jgi:hypothetical protein
MDERQINPETQLDKAVRIAKPDAFNRGIYNIGRIRPIAPGMQPLARDQCGI